MVDAKPDRVEQTVVPMSFQQFSEKFYVSLATNGLTALGQDGSSPKEWGMPAKCVKAYLQYVHTLEVYWPEVGAKALAEYRRARAAKPEPVAAK